MNITCGMEKKSVLFSIFLIAMFVSSSCRSQGQLNEQYFVDKADSLALRYVKSIISDNDLKVDTVYVTIKHQYSYKGCDNIYVLSVSSFIRPIENQDMPFHYTIVNDESFFFSHIPLF
ncbi:hypothetical protein LVD15_23310 [Fulvivirga maritima]|uniref:hypothetical protein n=1 Tax=Fulvivirga maritima TaxID=2904247 RepID=UPI001F47E6FF|nr:hypothetical protein [Fulvivirga maritima]UII26198.1 hypothetical protein LVD15_23310 [Fulvivirga maritima]